MSYRIRLKLGRELKNLPPFEGSGPELVAYLATLPEDQQNGIQQVLKVNDDAVAPPQPRQAQGS